MKKKRLILPILLLLFLLIQFWRIEKTNPQIVIENDLLSAKATNTEVANLIRSSCYDCHSNQTNYPWYANIAPLSWLISNHIEEGREHLNFSEWGLYSHKRQLHKLEECYEELEEDEMPLKAYTSLHSEANLNDTERKTLILYFKNMANNMADSIKY